MILVGFIGGVIVLVGVYVINLNNFDVFFVVIEILVR